MSLGGPTINRQPHRPAPRPPTHAREPVTTKIPDKKAAQRIGHYEVKKTLGEGSFGKVKLATHIVTKQEVALKIISRKKLNTRDLAGRVEREIQYLQLLRHPHIIKLYGTTSSFSYFGTCLHMLILPDSPSSLLLLRSSWSLNMPEASFSTTS